MKKIYSQGVYTWSKENYQHREGLGITAATRNTDVNALLDVGADAALLAQEGESIPCLLYHPKLGFCNCLVELCRVEGDRRIAPFVRIIACGASQEPEDYCFDFPRQSVSLITPATHGELAPLDVDIQECLELSKQLPMLTIKRLAWLLQMLLEGMLDRDALRIAVAPGQSFCDAAIILHRLLPCSLRRMASTAPVDRTGFRLRLLQPGQEADIDLNALPESACTGWEAALYQGLAKTAMTQPAVFSSYLQRLESDFFDCDLVRLGERLRLAAAVLLPELCADQSSEQLSALRISLRNRCESFGDEGYWAGMFSRFLQWQPIGSLDELFSLLKAQPDAVALQRLNQVIEEFYQLQPDQVVNRFTAFRNSDDFIGSSLLAMNWQIGGDLAKDYSLRELARAPLFSQLHYWNSKYSVFRHGFPQAMVGFYSQQLAATDLSAKEILRILELEHPPVNEEALWHHIRTIIRQPGLTLNLFRQLYDGSGNMRPKDTLWSDGMALLLSKVSNSDELSRWDQLKNELNLELSGAEREFLGRVFFGQDMSSQEFCSAMDRFFDFQFLPNVYDELFKRGAQLAEQEHNLPSLSRLEEIQHRLESCYGYHNGAVLTETRLRMNEHEQQRIIDKTKNALEQDLQRMRYLYEGTGILVKYYSDSAPGWQLEESYLLRTLDAIQDIIDNKRMGVLSTNEINACMANLDRLQGYTLSSDELAHITMLRSLLTKVKIETCPENRTGIKQLKELHKSCASMEEQQLINSRITQIELKNDDRSQEPPKQIITNGSVNNPPPYIVKSVKRRKPKLWVWAGLIISLLVVIIVALLLPNTARTEFTTQLKIIPPSYPLQLIADYGDTETQVRITVEGKRKQLKQLEAADFSATLDLSQLAAGYYHLPINMDFPEEVLLRNTQFDYEPQFVTLRLDYFDSREFVIELNVAEELSQQLLWEEASLDPSELTIKAYQTELSAISKVEAVLADGQVPLTQLDSGSSGEQTESYSTTLRLRVLNAQGDDITDSISLPFDEVKLTVPRIVQPEDESDEQTALSAWIEQMSGQSEIEDEQDGYRGDETTN